MSWAALQTAEILPDTALPLPSIAGFHDWEVYATGFVIQSRITKFHQVALGFVDRGYECVSLGRDGRWVWQVQCPFGSAGEASWYYARRREAFRGVVSQPCVAARIVQRSPQGTVGGVFVVGYLDSESGALLACR